MLPVVTTATAPVKALLVASGLPIDDLEDPSVRLFALHLEDRLVGVVGLQQLDGCSLLRSLAVEPDARARGLGARLCAHALREARGDVWLLTTSARRFFARRGFVEVPREEVPAALRATAQFSSLCPSSAVVMRRAAERR